MVKNKLAEAAGEHIKHRITDGYEEDMKRREDMIQFLDKMIEFGRKLRESESK